jgi:hypothetical protein
MRSGSCSGESALLEKYKTAKEENRNNEMARGGHFSCENRTDIDPGIVFFVGTLY